MDKYILKLKSKNLYFYGYCEYGPDRNKAVTFTRAEIMELGVDQPEAMSQLDVIKLNQLSYED